MRNTTRQRIRKQGNQNETPSIQDAAGSKFDPAIHIAPDAFTKAGLFKLKPGKKRS